MTADQYPAGVQRVPADDYLNDFGAPDGRGVAVTETWPQPDPRVLHGLAGDFVRMIEPHSEADPMALLTQFLTAYGNVIGRCAYQEVEAERHYMKIFMVIVAQSAKGRKGTSWAQVMRVMRRVDPDWAAKCLFSGVSTGEGLIHHLRDPRKSFDSKSPTIDPGVDDKRALVIATEFASILKVMERNGNSLSATLRDAWDRGDLKTQTKGSAEFATDTHVSAVAHITEQELRRLLTSTEAANGFANRFLWVAAKRSKFLPDGGSLSETELDAFTARLDRAVYFGRGVSLVRRDDLARTEWHRVYLELAADVPGLFGAVTARAEAQVLRLSGIYALLDESETIRVDHIRAAHALWRYSSDSARMIFGCATGDDVADQMLTAITAAAEQGQSITRTDVQDLLGRHVRAARITAAETMLARLNLIKFDVVQTGGRPATVYRLPDREGSEGSEETTEPT